MYMALYILNIWLKLLLGGGGLTNLALRPIVRQNVHWETRRFNTFGKLDTRQVQVGMSLRV